MMIDAYRLCLECCDVGGALYTPLLISFYGIICPWIAYIFGFLFTYLCLSNPLRTTPNADMLINLPNNLSTTRLCVLNSFY